MPELDPGKQFVICLNDGNNNHTNANAESGDPVFCKKKYAASKIVQVWLSKTSIRSKNIFKDKTIELKDANGSIDSILDWSSKCFGNDKLQRRSFEVIISSFLLTFYDESVESSIDPAHQASLE